MTDEILLARIKTLEKQIETLEEELKEAKKSKGSKILTPAVRWVKRFLYINTGPIFIMGFISCIVLFIGWARLGIPTDHFYVELLGRYIKPNRVCVCQEYNWGKDLVISCHKSRATAAVQLSEVREFWQQAQEITENK